MHTNLTDPAVENELTAASISDRPVETLVFRNIVSYLVLLLLLWQSFGVANAQIIKTDSRGRRWSQLIEPPPPDPNWDKLREQQLTLAQRLSELGITAEYKVTGGEDAGGLVELLPDGMQISGALIEGDRFKFELGALLPKPPGAIRSAMAKVSLEFKANTPTVSEVGFEGPISLSTKITSSVRYDQIHDPNWSVGVEIQKLFAKFKGEFANGEVNRTVEISLINLFNSARGLASPDNLPRDLIIKVETVKFYNAVVKAIKEEVASTPDAGSKVVKGLFVQFNPVLMVAAMRNDRSMLAVQNAANVVQQAMARRFPKGVKIQYNDELLGEMLRRAKGAPSLTSLARELEFSKTSADAESKVTKYIEDLTSAYRSTELRESPRVLTMISLKRLVTEAENYRDRWRTLPEDLATPGQIGRIVGYRIDLPNDDIYLIGIPSATASMLSLDEIINGVAAAFVNNESPFCSLDPDPANLGGVQAVRVGGVPMNSRFARTMLDADYLMKEISAGIVKVDSRDYKPIDSILRERSDRAEHQVMSRLWFYPVPHRPGDIELSADGQVVFFSGGMQVLSEQMVYSRDGLVGTGRSDAITNELAVGFTKALPEIEKQFADIGRLHGLFDLVLLGRIWRQMGVRSQWIDRLATLPAATLADRTYDGVTAKVYSGATTDLDLYFTGGVRLRASASKRAMLVVNDPAQTIIRDASLKENAAVATQFEFGRSLPSAAGAIESSMDAVTITGMIARGEFDRATTEIQKLLAADPFDPEVWCLKAENDLQRSRFVSAIDNAERALELAPDDPENQVRASVDLFTAHFMLGESEDALAAVQRAAQSVPDSLSARLFNADALAALGRFEEARKEFRSIQRAFPYSAETYLRFGLFEISEGNIMTGKRDFIDRALMLSRADRDISAAESALALAEVGMATLEDPETHLQKAEALATKVLGDKSSGPLSRLRALTARSIVALAKGNVAEADAVAEQVMRITPANPTILLTIAQWAYYSKRPELALQYLTRAEKIAPNMPLVRAVGAKIRGQQ
ncbi:MAG: tetratricopeptide repeat protein [Pyrinomonadaceae bacterium]